MPYAAEDPTVHRIPEKAHHLLTPDARLKALASTRQRTSNFVCDMISAGLLPITSNLEKFAKQPANMIVKQRTEKQLDELTANREQHSKE